MKKGKGQKLAGLASSKKVSKFVLQNVMQFFYWKVDGNKVRLICKKFKGAYDMHIINLT